VKERKESGRFFEKKLRKKLLSWGFGRWKRRSDQGVDARFRGHDGLTSTGGKLTKVFCGAFLQKSDRLL